MMWVNEILPPRARLRWLFITSRLSATSFAGMSRTLVAVGTVRLASMFATVRAAAPFSGLSRLRLRRALRHRRVGAHRLGRRHAGAVGAGGPATDVAGVGEVAAVAGGMDWGC